MTDEQLGKVVTGTSPDALLKALKIIAEGPEMAQKHLDQGKANIRKRWERLIEQWGGEERDQAWVAVATASPDALKSLVMVLLDDEVGRRERDGQAQDQIGGAE